MQKVEQTCVDAVNFACAVIPKDMINRGAGIGRVSAILPILNGEGFAGV